MGVEKADTIAVRVDIDGMLRSIKHYLDEIMFLRRLYSVIGPKDSVEDNEAFVDKIIYDDSNECVRAYADIEEGDLIKMLVARGEKARARAIESLADDLSAMMDGFSNEHQC